MPLNEFHNSPPSTNLQLLFFFKVLPFSYLEQKLPNATRNLMLTSDTFMCILICISCASIVVVVLFLNIGTKAEETYDVPRHQVEVNIIDHSFLHICTSVDIVIFFSHI